MVDIDTASLMWKEGKTVAEIIAALRISKDKFLRIRNEDKHEFPDRKPPVTTSINPEKYKKAKQLWSEKYSIRSIAAIISVTPSAMSGMMGRNRHDFPARYGDMMKRNYSARSLPVKPKRTIAEAAQEKQVRLSANKLRQAFTEALIPHPLPKQKEQHAEYDKSRLPFALTLIDLDTKTQCSWCVTDHPKGIPNLMCAEVKAGKQYCANHEARAWRAK